MDPAPLPSSGSLTSGVKVRKGNGKVKHKTAASRFNRSLSRVRQWRRRWRHEPVAWQQQQLSRGLHGHYAYYLITGNYQALSSFRQVTWE
jgi:RNA-directed DNA polymerase